MAAPGSATCPVDVSMMSARGSQMLTSSWPLMTSALTWSMLTESTGQTGSASRWVPHVSGTGSLTSGSRVSGLTRKETEERRAVYGLKLGLGRLGSLLSSTWFGSGSTGRLGELGCWVHSSAGRLRTSALWVGSRTWQAGSLAAQLLLLFFSFFSSSFTG